MESKYFTIVGSKTLRQNSKYHVSVSSHGYEAPQKIEVSIKGEELTSQGHQKIVTLTENKTEILEYDFSNLIEGNYFLEAKSVDGEKFERKVKLDLNLKKFSVFVQTDKSTYKPSDKIQFRVLLLDIDTKPFESSNVVIYVMDGEQNRVKQFLDPKFKKGVFEGKLQLSDCPVMGSWSIFVKVDNQEEQKCFEVAEYVLPKFEVIVDANPHVSFFDGKIRATVSGKYTFGKLAKGKAVVTAKISNPRYYGWGANIPEHEKVEKIVEIDGKKEIEFDIKEELKIDGIDNDRTVEIEASLTEELSGKEHKGSTTVTVHSSSHVIDIVKSNEKIKPGLPYSVTAFVKTHNGAPVLNDAENPIDFVVTYYRESVDNKPVEKRGRGPPGYFGGHNEVTERRFEKIFLENGAAKLSIDVPINVLRLEVDVSYKKTYAKTYQIYKYESRSGQYLQLNVLTKNPKVGEKVEIEVLATEDMKNLISYIHNRCDILSSSNVEVGKSKSFKFNFTATKAMMPTSRLLVYYLRDDGEIISDNVEIKFGFTLENRVNIDMSTEQAKPGESFTLTVKSDPNSFVGLLGVDQSVLLMKSGNDLDKSSISDNFNRYNEADHYNSHYDENNYQHIYHDFENSNLAIITNAKEEYETPRLAYCCFRGGAKMLADAPEMMMMARSEVVQADSIQPQVFAMEPMVQCDMAEQPKVVMRQKFPETFIFDSLDLSEGKNVLSKTVPDTITSWIITAFAVDPETGLALMDEPKKLNVFQPFFVSTNLPYSIKRGEVVTIPIIVFNYMEQDQQVEVSLFNDENEFEFTESEKPSKQIKLTKSITVKSNDGSTVNFMMKAVKAGNIKIKVTATSATAGDGLEQMLIVEPEGVTQYKNKALFIDLRNVKEFKTNFCIEIPENAVPDSTKIEVSAIGDILGPSIENLDKLIQIPYGCGEQNMLNFVPNIIVLEYLTILQKLTPEIALKSKKYMEMGYQRELTYKHHDGSYSAFGNSDRCGSTWLTAFVAKSFHQASKYIQIEDDHIKQALRFLSQAQDQNGSFKENGTVFHTDMQGGSSKGLALTAYVLITFLENEKEIENYRSTVEKALNYIVSNSKDLEDNYSLAITAYAILLAKHTLKDSLIEKLDNQAEKDPSGLMHWSKQASKEDEKNSWNHQPNAINIEMTAYALQAFVEAGKDSDSVPILKWLVTQRNKNGGFQSTQDTVVGLQSLSKLAAKMFVPDSQISITLNHGKGALTNLNVNSENALVLQKYELPPDARNFEVSAVGKGFGVLQISYKFNIDENGKSPRFVLNPEVQETTNSNVLDLKVATSYIADEYSKKSNMAVMEVSFPSGFTFDADHLAVLMKASKVKRVETKDGETVVIVYFDDIDTNEMCLDFKAVRTHQVAELKPAAVMIYDYYDNSRRASTFYNLR